MLQTNFFRFIPLIVVFFFQLNNLAAQNRKFPKDTLINQPWSDFNFNKPLFQRPGLSPSNYFREITFDPTSKEYILSDKIGQYEIRPSVRLNFKEFLDYEARNAKKNYWNYLRDKYVGTDQSSNRTFPWRNNAFQRIFGANGISIKPKGYVEFTVAAKRNITENPLLNEFQRKQWGLDFTQNLNLNFDGMIGSRIKVTGNFNTAAQFDFENQIKFQYIPKDNDVLRELEIGNINLSLNNSLIRSSEALFGVKTKFQFGKLQITNVLSQKKSRVKEITFQQSQAEQTFQIRADQYEANKHFFLAQYFRNHYESNLQNAPLMANNLQITQTEVWVTNRSNNSSSTRNVVGLLDLAENKPFNPLISGSSAELPFSQALNNNQPFPNNLLTLLGASASANNASAIQDFFTVSGGTNNYAKLLNARKLQEGTDYTLNRRLGYLSLNAALRDDDILTVAYRYTLNGQEYQVGELSTDQPENSVSSRMLITKLLKNETINTSLPTWNLMMKNIYALGSAGMDTRSMEVTILRTENTSGADQKVMREGQNTSNKLWLEIMGLDRLNAQNFREPDGKFDIIEGITINSASGKIIFPVLEPFGEHLNKQFVSGSEQHLKDKYVFEELYLNTPNDAQQLFPNKNRYIIQGKYLSGASSLYQLGIFNLPAGSVKIYSGTFPLKENTDYAIDYASGQITFLNPVLGQSGQSFRVTIDDQEMVDLQSKTLFATRFDYAWNPQFKLGATYLHYQERPFSEKVNLQQIPVSNQLFGFDIQYSSTPAWLNQLIRKLPFVNPEEESSIQFYGEFAQLNPKVSSGIKTALDPHGAFYIDDFENSITTIDLKQPQAWTLASTPKMFPESNLSNNLQYGYNRALISFYTIDNLFFRSHSPLKPAQITMPDLLNHRVRPVMMSEIFPEKQVANGLEDEPLPTLDITYYPKEPGPYNFETNDINAEGLFIHPHNKWAGMMRKIEQTDFEAQQIAFLEMWMMDPRLTNPNKEGGDFYINLGNISEDILKDGKKSMENALPGSNEATLTEETVWGKISKIQPSTQSFDQNKAKKALQDVGLDGLSDEDEQLFHQNYLNQLQPRLSTEVFESVKSDPSRDNFIYFKDPRWDEKNAKILERYKYINGVEKNSVNMTSDAASATITPDGEDVNHDNNMNESDDYYQYRISLRPNDFETGKNFVVDQQYSTVTLADGRREKVTWYKLRIPIDQYQQKTGQISNFKNIRFLRLFLTQFTDTTTIRLARLQFVRGEWRKYNPENNPQKLITDVQIGNVTSDQSTFEWSTINLEENSDRSPIPYVVPPGVNRQVDVQHNNLNVELNEQAVQMNIQQLRRGFGRAIFKTVQQDLRPYQYVQLFVHAEGERLKNKDAHFFIRLGTDDQFNYYQFESPLITTPAGTRAAEIIWPVENRMKIHLKAFQEAKLARNKALYQGVPWPQDIPFDYYENGQKYTIVGSPDLSKIRYYMLGIKNPYNGQPSYSDGEDMLNGTFWFNELRLTNMDESSGWAAISRLDVKLADFAQINLTGTTSTAGFGNIYDNWNQRLREDRGSFSITSDANLGKLLNPKWRLSIPFYFTYAKETGTPQFDPNNPDITLKTTFHTLNRTQQDSLLQVVRAVTLRKNMSFNNVRLLKTNNSPVKIWDIENLQLNYGFSSIYQRDFLTKSAIQNNYTGSLIYNFTTGEPLLKYPFQQSKWKLLRHIQYNLIPSLLHFRMDVNRIYSENTYRDNSDDNILPTYYSKNFNISRIYGMSWNITEHLKLDFNATNYALVDEPSVRMDGLKRDTVWSNFWKMGRTTDYNHTLNINYALPFDQIKPLNWINTNIRYGAQFHWQSAPSFALQQPIPGNANDIQNNRILQLNPVLNFSKLYQKFGFYKRFVAGQQNNLSSVLLQFATIIKRLEMGLTKNQGIFLPGYLPKTNLLGYSFDANAPGFSFLMGSQKDISIKAIQQGWLTTDPVQTQLYTQTFAENLTFRAFLEAFKGLNIELNAVRVDNHNISSSILFNSVLQQQEVQTPFVTGNYNITQIGMKTIFKNHLKLFETFEQLKVIMSQRLGENNVNSAFQNLDGYKDGYSKNQQEVVVNSFLAAYLGKNPTKFTLSKMPRVPLPNWRINYNGNPKTGYLSEWLQSIQIHHSYNSQFAISGYNNILQYSEKNDASYERNLQNDFLPKNQYQQISVIDQFVPLLGVDLRFKNNVNTSSEVRKSRHLTLNLLNTQIAQFSETNFIIGFGFRKPQFQLPFGILSQRKANNELTMRMDFAWNDRKTTLYRSDVTFTEIIAGNKSLSFNPSIDFFYNQRVNFHFFLMTNAVRPYTSYSYATAYTNLGFNVKIMLPNK